MSRFAVLLYPSASLQEITCLTAALSVWYGESIDYIAGEDKEYRSEEGLRLLPTKTAAEADPAGYDCVILPGTIDPLPALHDEALVAFLRRGIGTNTVFAAISSAPLLLCRAGLLKGKKFTAGFFMQMVDVFPFVEKKNFVHQGVATDGNVITGIGMFYRRLPRLSCGVSGLTQEKALCAPNRRIIRRTTSRFTGRRTSTVSFWKSGKSTRNKRAVHTK